MLIHDEPYVEVRREVSLEKRGLDRLLTTMIMWPEKVLSEPCGGAEKPL